MKNRPDLMQYSDPMRAALFPGGKFYLIPRNNATLEVITSTSMGWEHVSIVVIQNDRDTRQPTYEEMVFVKGLFWDNDEISLEIHPKKSEYVNVNPDCLHLWKRIGEDYTEMSKIVKDFIKTFPQNDDSALHVTHLVLNNQSYCIVAGPKRWPTWNELCDIKNQYFESEEAAVQYHFDKATDLNSKFIVVIASFQSSRPSVFQV